MNNNFEKYFNELNEIFVENNNIDLNDCWNIGDNEKSYASVIKKIEREIDNLQNSLRFTLKFAHDLKEKNAVLYHEKIEALDYLNDKSKKLHQVKGDLLAKSENLKRIVNRNAILVESNEELIGDNSALINSNEELIKNNSTLINNNRMLESFRKEKKRANLGIQVKRRKFKELLRQKKILRK